jgi:Ribonuclease G/E
MYAIRIRGIYTTALSKLFLDNGFRITQPSEVIRGRLGIGESIEPPDIDIIDREDLQGVLASGTPQAMKSVKSVLQKIPCVITRPKVGLYSIYLGVVQSVSPKGAYIDLGEEVGFLPGFLRNLKSGQRVMVQVASLEKKPLLRQDISIGGRYAVLISSGRIAVSKKIKDLVERERLCWLGARLSPWGWGVVWRTASFGKAEEDLKEEMERLAGLAKKLEEKGQKTPPCLLLDGEKTISFEFPGGAKEKLDEIRSKVTATIAGHHKYKAGGEITVDSKEETLKVEREDKGLYKADLSCMPSVGAMLTIEHVKINGEVMILGRGKVVSSDPKKGIVKVERKITPGGRYDGLDMEKEEGDRALTEFREGSWSYKTCYYSRLARLKGEYYNINTPLEIYPDRIRYVDLEIDVVWVQGQAKILDREKLLKSVEKGYIGDELASKAQTVAETIAKELEKEKKKEQNKGGDINE